MNTAIPREREALAGRGREVLGQYCKKLLVRNKHLVFPTGLWQSAAIQICGGDS
jgi:hypothetical protein